MQWSLLVWMFGFIKTQEKAGKKSIFTKRLFQPALAKTIMQMKRHDNKLFNGVLEVALFGLSLSLGGQLVSWNIGLLSGFYTFWIAVGIVAMGYCCLTYCTAEMTSVLPFSGGSYGLCRVTLGSSMGYMIGCFESLQSVVFAATMTSILGSMSTHVFGTSASLEPVWWALVYISAFVLQLMGSNHLAQITIAVTSVTLLLIAIYCLGTAKDMNFIKFAGGVSHYSGDHESTWGHARHFMFCLPHACWFFLGAENIPIVCTDTVKSVKTVPRAMLYVYCVSVVTGIALLFSCASQSPGITDLAQYSVLSPLMYGYSHLFNISTSLTVLFVIPGTYATAFGFMFIFGRQLNAMAKSGLFPKPLALVYQWKLQQQHSAEGSELNVDVNAAERVIPVGALVAGSVLGYAILLALFFSKYDRGKIRTLLFNVSLLGSFSVNICTFLSFLMYRRKYSSLDKGRPFHNPFGKLRCATVGLSVFALAAVGVCGFQRDGHHALIIFAVYSVCMAVYYVLVARSRQFFSAEEQAVLIVAYIINANSKGHKKLTRSASFKRENSFSGRIMKRSESMRSLLSREDTNTSANIVVSRQLSVSLRSAATGAGHRANSTRTNSRDMSMSSDKSHPRGPLVESIDEADGNTAVGGVDYLGGSLMPYPQGFNTSSVFAKLHCINEREEGPKSSRADDYGPGSTSLPESSLGASDHKEERVGDTQDCVTVSATDINAAVDSADPMSCEQSLFSTANCTAEADKLACSFTVQDPPVPVQSYSLVAETEEERALAAVERMLSAKQLSTVKKGSTKSRSDVNNNTDSKDGSQRSRGESLNGGEDASQHSKSSKNSIQTRLGLFGSNKNSHSDSQRNVALFDDVAAATKPAKVRQGWMPTSTKAVLPVDTSMSGIALQNNRRQSQYAAPEEEGEEEPLGSVRLKKQRRPSLLSSFLGGFVSHNQSRGGSFLALTSQPQSSKGGFSMGGSFSALNSSSLSRILPVIDLESPDFDEYTNEVVSRLIADNLGADFLLSLAENSMERADEEQGQAEQEQNNGQVLLEEAENEKCADEEGVQKALHQQQKNYNNNDNSACDSALEDAMDREVSARILHIARQHYRHAHADNKGWDKGNSQGSKALGDLV